MCNNQIGSLKIKVILRDQRSKLGAVFLVRAGTWPWIEGFLNNSAEMLAAISSVAAK